MTPPAIAPATVRTPISSRAAAALVLLVLLGAAGARPGSFPPRAGTPADPRPSLGPVREIPSPAPSGSSEPNLVAGPRGEVLLSWIEQVADGAHRLRFSFLREGAWGEPLTVAAGRDWFVNWADFPSMAILSDGSLAAHWLVRSPLGHSAYTVQVARSMDGGRTWGAPLTPHRDGTASEHGFVSLWEGRGLSLDMVWLDGRKVAASEAPAGGAHAPPAGEMTLRHTAIGPDGALGREVELDGRVCACCQTAAAVTSEGPIVVYRDRSDREVRDISLVRLLRGTWTDPRPIAEDGWAINACPVNGPAAAAEGRRVAVAWFTAASQMPRVLASFSSDAGATFGRAIRVDAGHPIGRVAIVLLEEDAALVSWVEQTGEQAEVRLRKVRAEGPIGPSLTVAPTSSARASGFPRMARAGKEVIVAWTDPGHGDTPHVRTASVARSAEPR